MITNERKWEIKGCWADFMDEYLDHGGDMKEVLQKHLEPLNPMSLHDLGFLRKLVDNFNKHYNRNKK